MDTSNRLSRGLVSPAWFRGDPTHAKVAEMASASLGQQYRSKRLRRATESAQTSASSFDKWPRRTHESGAPPPPVVSPALVREIEQQDVGSSPDQPQGPAATRFIKAMAAWQRQLAEHFGLSSSCFWGNTRRAAERIRSRLSFLPRDRRDRIMRILTKGYTIPFSSRPPPFHRPANGPDLAEHRDAAWDALKKDIDHGAVVPCNVAVRSCDSTPTMLPQRTANRTHITTRVPQLKSAMLSCRPKAYRG